MAGRLEVVCDGAGAERVGRPGGWAFVVLREGTPVGEGSGAEAKTSGLVMELTAALRGLETAARLGAVDVVLRSDSSIALDVAAGRFLPRPVRYHALCRALREAFVRCGARTEWVKGHAGERWNEEVDRRAAAARDALVAPKHGR